MRSRITGGIGFLLGLVIIAVMLFRKEPFELKPFLGGLAFLGLGGYYMITGKRAATKEEFIRDGKLAHDDPPEEKKA